jgi:hypothetical protein
VVRQIRVEPSLSEILSFRLLPIERLTHVESRQRFELSMFCIGGRVPSAGRDRLESSSGVEPLSVRLEGAGPYSLVRMFGANYGSRTRQEFFGKDFPHHAVIRISGSFEWNQTTRLRVISSALYH